MVPWSVCPGEEAIAAFAAGRLEREERDALEAHLDTCSACTELVAVLAKAAGPTARESGTIVPEPTTVEDALLAGQLGRYVLLSRIGAGGMGVVYAAYDPELDRRVALKLLRHARPGIELRDEARAIAKLAHPNVVAVYDVGREGEATFVAMEFVDGTTLADWLRDKREPREVLAMFVQAGRGLAAAHAVGLTHRDVKPSNVMIGRDGRARVLDFGLAREVEDRGGGGGTPAYIAPEQARGDAVDARADQFSFCVALWEALSGERPEGNERTLPGVPDRVVRALRRGLSPERDARFPALDELLVELAPPRRSRRPWIVAASVAIVALAGTIVYAATRPAPAATCERAGAAVAETWNAGRGDALRAAFAATTLPYATTAATTAIAQLDGWAARWRAGAEATCRATSIERVQPPAIHALRQACLDELLEQLRPLVAIAVAADATVVQRADVLVGSLPAPERCTDVTALAPVPPSESSRAEVDAIRKRLAELEAAMLAGRANQVVADVDAIVKRADATGYLSIRARAAFLAGRLESTRSHYTESIVTLHRAAQLATGARDLAILAEIWIYLVQSYGNDLRTLDQATLFDGYVSALVEQLPDRAGYELRLAHARCQRNVTSTDAAKLIAACTKAIDLCEHANPPLPMLANADRTRLGHFQRIAGKRDEAIATLTAAVAEAKTVFGAQHPDTGLATYALGIAYASAKQFDKAIPVLRDSLAIRRVAYPGDSIQVAEALQGLGDALGESGATAESIQALEDALAMLDRIHEGESAHAANIHTLLGLTLEDAHRPDDAIVHYLRSADIADRSLEHSEALAATGLRLAANLEGARPGHLPTALAHLERALRLLERGKTTPDELGQTQFRIAEIALLLKDPDRARAMAEAARGSFLTAKDDKQVAVVDAFLATNHWAPTTK